MAATESRFRAMGCEACILAVDGPDGLVDAAVDLVEELEAKWSRFRPTSEISRLNALPDRPVVVSPDTFELVVRAAYAWRATGGAFDPTVLPSLVDHGYDRTFDEIDGTASPGSIVAWGDGRAAASPGCAGITTDPFSSAVTLPTGVAIDPGGIGKGLAADIVVEAMRHAGARGAMVDLGGDVRVDGRPPEGDVWVVSIEDPNDPGHDLARVRLTGGAVATSSTQYRRWMHEGVEVHHLIDPATGRPYGDDIVSVTVVAAEGWWAEVMTKVVFADGLGALTNADAIVVDYDGGVTTSPGFDRMAA